LAGPLPLGGGTGGLFTGGNPPVKSVAPDSTLKMALKYFSWALLFTFLVPPKSYNPGPRVGGWISAGPPGS